VETLHRPAVRVVCLDASGRVLLLRWRDPGDGAIIWEPPGGGIEPGESTVDAARRELTEETGLDPEGIGPTSIDVERDTTWNGRRFVGPETFFLARYPGDRPELSRAGLLADEHDTLTGHDWIAVAELSHVDGRLEPPALAAAISALVELT
jgi:8-oxo-dGTP pyrophosphatase MutT (NUDIX family)